MPYIYTGPAGRLVIAGQTLVRGVPAELDGRAAAAAAAHPHIASAALAVVEAAAEVAQSGQELRATLGEATVAQLRELADERDIDLDGASLKAELVEVIATVIEDNASGEDT